MRSYDSPAFGASNWGMLWHNNIPDIETLHWRANRAGAVVVKVGRCSTDCEQLSGSFELCFIDPIKRRSHQKPLQDFKRFKLQYNARSHVVRTCRSEFVNQKHLEVTKTAVSFVLPCDVDIELCELIDSFKRQLPAYDTEQTLVVYDPKREFQILSAYCSRFLGEFESWVDLSELTREFSPPHDKMGLASALEAFGYNGVQKTSTALDEDWPPLMPEAEDCDCLRIAAVFANIFWHPRGSKVGSMPLWDREALKDTIRYRPQEHIIWENEENACAKSRQCLPAGVPAVWEINKRLPDGTSIPGGPDYMMPLDMLPFKYTLWYKQRAIFNWAVAVMESEPYGWENSFPLKNTYSDEELNFDVDLSEFSFDKGD